MADKKPEDLVFGEGRWVYCTQHVNPHTTGWCTVPAREKILLDATERGEAVAECRQKGYRLYDDVRKELGLA